MKKVIASFLLLSLCSINSIAQVRHTGTPFTQNTAYSSFFSSETYVPQTGYRNPDINSLIQEDLSKKHTPFEDVRIGAAFPVDISFPSSGVITTLNDGRQVWRAQIKVPGALALGLYYDKFNLPQGVNYYLSNANGKQLLGAYTYENNTDDGLWANEKVQGEVINLEMDIEAGVDLSRITMHINNAVSFYRAMSYLQPYTDNPDATTIFTYGLSSPCEVNAICPLGASYPDQRLATVNIQYIKGNYEYAGSATLMNNVRQDCTPYVMTASHVEPTNSTSNTTFSQWMFYFNYETPTCTYTGSQPTNQTMVGATFVARSSYDSASNAIVGDFLMVKLKSNVPASYSAYFAGWDISTAAPTGTCIGFHHPMGDVKKVSTTSHVYANGNFNNGQANSHWSVAPMDNGGFEEGSSGSGLFNASGRLIGDLSGGISSQEACTDTNAQGDKMSNYGEYSKLTLNWLYVYQQPSDSTTRLKDWLDPDNTGATTLDAKAANCNGFPSSVNQVNTINNTVYVYPSPSTGVVYVNGNFSNATSAKIEVFNIIGDMVFEAENSSAQLSEYKIDLTGKTPGVYLVRVTAGSSIITKKVLIEK